MKMSELNALPAGIYCVELDDADGAQLVKADGCGWFDGMGWDDGATPEKILGGPWTVADILQIMSEQLGD